MPSAAPLLTSSVAPASPQPGDRQERLRTLCQEFEGVFLGLLMRQMQATVPRFGALSLGTAGDTYESLWAQEVGRAAARSGPLGIARQLIEWLSPAITLPAVSSGNMLGQRAAAQVSALKPDSVLTEDKNGGLGRPEPLGFGTATGRAGRRRRQA